MNRPRPASRRVMASLAGSAILAGGLIVAGTASAATETPQIVLVEPDANLSAIVRSEERRGNDVDQVIRTIGKGFVADLDRADIARLKDNPDVILVEPDRPVQLIGGVTAAEAGTQDETPAPAWKTQSAVNDPFAGAEAITGNTGRVAGTTVGASREAGEPGHGGSGASASIWYRWTAPSNGTVTVTTQGSSFDTLLGAYTGTAVSGLTARATNDDAPGGLWSTVTFTVTAGTTYYLAVDGYGGWKGATVLNWAMAGETPAPPTVPNDMFSDAQEISGASGSASGTTVGAKREAGEPTHGDASGRASVWYRWTAPSTGTLQLSTRGSSFDTLLAAYSGTAITGLSQLAANDDASGGLWSEVSVPVTEGTTYRIAVDGWGGYTGSTSLTWSMAAPAPAPTPTPTPSPSPSPTPAPNPGGSDRAAASWGLDRVDQAALPLNGRITTSQNGSGVTAYVIDTGVRPDHQDFGGRVTSGFSSISDGNGSGDCNGHGTHVAGTVAGGSYGVAPAATIVPVRVLSCSGSGSTSGVIAGIQYAVQHHQAGTPAVANMSLGGGYSAALNAAVAAGVADGISFVVAAGNSNDNACSYSPASEPTAITVGSTTSSDGRSYFSNWGSCLDVFAPGSGITSAWYTSPTSANTISGTSMASPHAAGAAALLLSAQPSATPAAVRNAMVQGATQNVVSDPAGSANALLNVSSGVTPPASSAPASDVTPGTAPRPSTSGPRGGAPPATTPPTLRRSAAPPAPKLIAAKRTTSGLLLSISGKGVGYEVLVNGKRVARTTSTSPLIRTKLAKPGAKVRVRAYNSGGISAPSNTVRL